jgi:hypothetical protein
MSTTTKSPKKLLVAAYNAAKRILPMYSHRFSPHKFTLHQLFACLVLKTFLKTDYRGLAQWLTDCPDLCRVIGLTCVPHFTTFHKASHGILALPIAHKLLHQTVCMTMQHYYVDNAAIDSTGLEVGYTSYYFVRRRHIKGLSAYQSMLYGHYPKLTVICDCKNHLILSVKTTRGPCPDMATLIPAVQTLPAWITVGTLSADAGYDSESNHVYARDYRKIITIIPPKAGRRTYRLPKTKYRRQMKERFNKKVYHQRAQVETVFSMIKRRWGTAVRARLFSAQEREMWLMVLTHNLAVFWVVKELFYRAKQTQFPKWRNEHNINSNNQLPITSYHLPLCKTKPNKPNEDGVHSTPYGL